MNRIVWADKTGGIEKLFGGSFKALESAITLMAGGNKIEPQTQRNFITYHFWCKHPSLKEPTLLLIDWNTDTFAKPKIYVQAKQADKNGKVTTNFTHCIMIQNES